MPQSHFYLLLLFFLFVVGRVPFYSDNHREGSFRGFSLNRLHKQEEVKLITTLILCVELLGQKLPLMKERKKTHVVQV